MVEKKDNRGGYRIGSGRPKKDSPRSTTVSFVCTPEEKKLIDDQADKQKLSRSKFIIQAIQHYIKSL